MIKIVCQKVHYIPYHLMLTNQKMMSLTHQLTLFHNYHHQLLTKTVTTLHYVMPNPLSAIILTLLNEVLTAPSYLFYYHPPTMQPRPVSFTTVISYFSSIATFQTFVTIQRRKEVFIFRSITIQIKIIFIIVFSFIIYHTRHCGRWLVTEL